MLLKQQDLMVLEKKVNTTPVDYAVLNQLSQDLEKQFVPQTELSAEQAFWSQNSMNSLDPSSSCRPTKVEVPKELLKVSMVYTSLKKWLSNKEPRPQLSLRARGEVDTQLNQEIFQRDNSVSNQSAPSFDQYFELNELKAQSQEKDTVIRKLKERIKSLCGNMNKDKVKKDIEEIETINIELALEDELRKLKGKALVDNVVTSHTIAPEMLKIDVEPIALKLLNNMIVHSDYLRQTQEQATILKKVVKQEKSHNPLNNSLDHACCSKHMTGYRSQLTNFVNRFLGTIKFGNDRMEKIIGYGDYQIGDVTISRVYYVEGLGHNLFFVGQLCNNLYTLSLGNMMASSPICLLSKASKTKSWLWHRRLSYLNFGAINHLARHNHVRGLPKLKFENDHLCSACTMGKSMKKPHKPKYEDTNQEKLYLLHMDLYGPMRVASVNEKKYILVIVDDYSRFTWQNGVVERRNRTLIEAARTMLIYVKAPLFLWAEAVATVCYTQNHSIIRLRHDKTPYELLHDKLPYLSFFHIFGALCYLTNNSENLGKLQSKADIDFDELTVMASEHNSLEPTLHEMTPATISSGLVPNPPHSTPFVPPSRTNWDILFQPLFDELLTHPPSVDHPTPEVIALIVEVVASKSAASTGLPSSTTVDEDAPSPSNSQKHLNLNL
uniref:GAG-pre-integrase domain-containing protein n=1 Tax=Tanacetum cinerariifolium TaxID=118510 RepID=A0A699GRE7_TANCI|nr:hypothetical protein [Tanacetum cinerariifolium]